MNLLIISDRYPHKDDPYSASFVRKLVKYEQKYFDNIYVISLNPWLPPFIAKKLSNPRWYRDAIAEDYSYDNVHVYFAKYFTLKGMFFLRRKDISAYKKIKKIIERENIKFDLVHAHFAHPAGTAAIRIKKDFNKPLVITGHGHDVREYPFLDTKLKNKIFDALSGADAFITVSKSNAELLKKAGYKGQITIIPNGFDPEIFKPRNIREIRQTLELPLDKKIIVSVGRLIERKGYIYLIEAVKKLSNKRKDFKVIVIGDGPLKQHLREEVTKRGINNIIEFIGEIKQDIDVAKYISAADFFVLPSLDEGNPTVMFESLGCGVPFVGTRVGGVPEIITSEEYGLLCDPKDVNSLAEKINIALNKDWNRERIVQYAQKFTWDAIAEQTIDIYKKTLNKDH